MRIPHTMVSGILLVLGLRARSWDPYVDAAFGGGILEGWGSKGEVRTGQDSLVSPQRYPRFPKMF